MWVRGIAHLGIAMKTCYRLRKEYGEVKACYAMPTTARGACEIGRSKKAVVELLFDNYGQKVAVQEILVFRLRILFFFIVVFKFSDS